MRIAILLIALMLSTQLHAQEKDDLDQAFAACVPHRHFDEKLSDTVFDQGWEECKTINEKWSLRNHDRWIKARAARTTKPPEPSDEAARQKMLGVANGLKEQH